MRKSFTKIICVATAAISVLGMGFASGCGNSFAGVTKKDSTLAQVEDNGGFAVQTGDFVYFINGKSSNTADNSYGSVVKGAIMRISKQDLNAHNYATVETVVPSIAYSECYGAGIYIYGDRIYYSTPSIEKNSNGEVQNGKLEFKSSKADGTQVSETYFTSPADKKDMEYRYVEVDGTVYLIYGLEEDSKKNIHSINTKTGEDTMLAYNVDKFAFDETNPENPYVYYTMAVTTNLGGSGEVKESYNQLFRVRADVKKSPRKYDFSYVDDYDAEKDPLYVNYGDFVFDGIGVIENGTETKNRISQFNYNYGSEKVYNLDHHDYVYAIDSYKNGTLLLTRADAIDDADKALLRVTDEQLGTTDGKVNASWDAIDANGTVERVLKVANDTEYYFLENNQVLYAGSDGLMMATITDGEVKGEYALTANGKPTVLNIKEETTLAEEGTATETHLYAYYSITEGDGNVFYRIAIDGDKTDYETNKMPVSDVWAYKAVRILDLDAVSSWYAHEFVGNTIIFASETDGMTAYNYVMACDLTSADGDMMSNKELNDYKQKMQDVLDKIDEYNEEKNDDGEGLAYENLTAALKYQYYTRDAEYLGELRKAYVDIKGEDEYKYYSKESVQISKDFAACEGDWADYKTDSPKTINGETVYSNTQDYYYSVLGKMSDADKDSLIKTYRSDMKAYPVDTSTWWDNLGTGGRVGFIIGMVAAGLLVVGAIVWLVIFLVRRKKKKNLSDDKAGREIDITDDKNIDVYADDEHTESQSDEE